MFTLDSSVTDMRTKEGEVIDKAQGEAQTEGDEKLDAFLKTNQDEVSNVAKQQDDSKSKDEAERQKVSDKLESIYTKTKSSVDAKLAGIEGTVMSMFETAANTAKTNFENHVDSSMKAYKQERYDSGWGLAKWAKDKLFGLPSEVKIFYTQASDGYVAEMDSAMVRIADFVAGELKAAKQLIPSGRDEINTYVDNLDPNLQKFAKEAATKISAKFTALEETVAAKQTELIDNLAQERPIRRNNAGSVIGREPAAHPLGGLATDNLGEIDTQIDEMMTSNQGFVQKAVTSVTSVIETINNMRNMLTSVITDGLSVINEILKHPIQFLSNLLQGEGAVRRNFNGVKIASKPKVTFRAGGTGFNQFASNITTHLQDGLSGWLFGTLGDAGIEIPSSFDLGGILSIITQVVGLTWNYIRARIVNFIGEENMAHLETTVEMFQAFRKDGVKGFKEAAAEEGAEMKKTVIGEIKSFVIQEVVQKGIIWILSLFNPASAFVKACMAIYDIVMFFVNRGAQIAELVQSVMGAISAVVAGNVSAMAGAIEGTLARGLPLAIGFMANLLGLGGLAAKVKGIIKKAQAPVNKVVDKVVSKAKNLAGKLTGKDDDDNDNEEGEKDEKWDKGVESLVRLQNQAKNKGKTEKQMGDALSGIKTTHGFDRLTKAAEGEFWEVKAVKGDKKKTLDIKADFEGQEQDEQAADPEVEAKAQEGFAELRAKAAKYDGDGASKEEADKIVADVKAKHPVFKILSIIDSEGDFDVRASYNPDKVFKDEITKEEISETKDSGHLLTSNNLASYQDLTIEDRPDGSTQKLGHDAKTKDGKQGIVVGNAGSESKYVEKVKKQDAEGQEFGLLNPLGIPARRSHIGKQDVHKDYKVTQSDLDFSESTADVFVVKYSYSIEQEGHAPEVRSFTVSINPKDQVRNIKGENLAVKDPGRGYTDSASNANLINKLATAYGLEPEAINIEFNASHLIADWFNGSGYSSAYNTLNASSSYNKKMTDVERSLHDSLKDSEGSFLNSIDKAAYMTFDMEVNVNMDEMKNSSIFTDMSAKLNAANGVETEEEKTAILLELSKELSSVKEPVIIQQTYYSISTAHVKGKNGELITTKSLNLEDTLGADTDLLKTIT